MKKRLLAFGIYFSIALGLFTWAVVTGRIALKDWPSLFHFGGRSEASQEIAALQREVGFVKTRSASVMNFGVRSRQLATEMVVVREKLAVIKAAGDLSSADLKRLAASEKEAGEIDAHLAKLEAIAVAKQQEPPSWKGKDRMPLSDYARMLTGSPKVRVFGFTDEAATRLHVYKDSDSITQSDVFRVSKTAFFEDTLSGSTFEFSLPKSLTKEHQFQPLPPASKETTVSALKTFRELFPRLEKMTIETCPGVVACDALVDEVRDLCKQAGFSVEVQTASEAYYGGLSPMESSLRIATDSLIFEKKEELINAFAGILNIENDHFSLPVNYFYNWINGRGSGGTRREHKLKLYIMGFPRFSDKGYATFDQAPAR